MKFILNRSWIERYLWPWTRFARLRQIAAEFVIDNERLNNALKEAQAELDAIRPYESKYQARWMALSNQYWGTRPFDENETTFMLHEYGAGTGWREALDRLRSAQGYSMKEHRQRRFDWRAQ